MELKNKEIAYTLLRITMGINFFGHGLARFSKLEGFKNWMVEAFDKTLIPSLVVNLWGSILPFVEFLIGLLLIVGLFTYRASIAGAIVIIILLFGSTLLEKWEWAGTQMIYAVFFYILITKILDNKFSIDKFFIETKNKVKK